MDLDDQENGRSISTDWKPGDLAECVFELRWENQHRQRASGPRKGEVRIVQDVRLASAFGRPEFFLGFSRYPRALFLSDCFRKIVPTADRAERGTATTIDDLLPARILEGADL